MADSYENAPDTPILDIARAIFSTPPREPFTVSLRLTEQSAAAFDEDDESDCDTEVFGYLALLGVSLLFQKQVSVFANENPREWKIQTDITPDQLELLQRYMKSMGVKVCIACNDDYADPYETVQNGGTIDHLKMWIEHLPLPESSATAITGP